MENSSVASPKCGMWVLPAGCGIILNPEPKARNVGWRTTTENDLGYGVLTIIGNYCNYKMRSNSGIP